MTATQLQNLWLSAQPGMGIVVDSDIGRLTLKRVNARPKRSPQVVIDLNGHTVTRLPEVGSSDTILLKSGVRDLKITNGVIQAASRAGIKTEGPGGARNIWLDRLMVSGGWDAEMNNLVAPNKWLSHHYMTGSWIESEMDYWGCADEHAGYFHNIQGNHFFANNIRKWCGRTALQIVNRKAENGTPMPEGFGDVTVVDEYCEDVCLEQGGGGSAYTFRGGMKDSKVTLQRVTVRLGCNENLHSSLRGRATGAFLMDSGPASTPATPTNPGSGDEAWDGGTKTLELLDPDFEVGTVYPGQGSAKRPNVKIGAVNGNAVLEDGRIVCPTGDVALEVFASCANFWWRGSPEVIGTISYKGEKFQTWDDFTKAHPECHDA